MSITSAIEELRGDFDGRVVAPEDDGYDEARAVFYGRIDRRPAFIVRPVDAAEVSRLVTLARESGRSWPSGAGVTAWPDTASPRAASSSISPT